MLVLNEAIPEKKPMKNRIQKRQKASENQTGIHKLILMPIIIR